MIGSAIGQYDILEKLGEGGMGVVYKATDTKLNRTVALKFLPDRVNKDGAAKARFLQEAQAAAGLNHPNICTVYGVDEHEGQLFISLEYVEGGTLRDRLPFAKTDDVIAVASQIGEALQEAHAKGIVHRDIKADNIMMSSKGQAKVMDFGLARLKGALKLTRTSSTVGTIGYMAPEQIQGGEVDPRSDVFSFGVLLFEMLTGKLPFRGEHEAAMMYSILNEEPDQIRKHLPNISTACERILEKALEKNPEERYQSAADVVADLRRWKRETSSVPRPTSNVGEISPVPSSANSDAAASNTIIPRFAGRKTILAVSGLLFTGLLVGGLFWLQPWTTSSSSAKKALAVIPFENQADPEREYFADGISEEITTRLSSLSGIGVIARSSAWQYKGTKKSVKEIGSELGIDYVLMGTVRWSRTEGKQLQVRISPALIDVRTGMQVWANTFDAAFQNAFALQSDIAQQVARALDVNLLSPEVSALEQNLTSNAEAYDYYLQGVEYENRSPSEADGDIAIQQYERAIALDPAFAAAYARLAVTHARAYWFFYDRTKERVAEARAAAEKALALDPKLSVSNEAMGWVHYHTELNYDAAIRQFHIALELQPSNPGVSYGLAAVYRRKGNLDESVWHWRKAIAYDPRSSELVRQLGETFVLQRKYAEADEQFATAIRLAPDNVSTYAERARNMVLWKGDLRSAEVILEEGNRFGRVGSGEDEGLHYTKFVFASMRGEYSSAEQAVRQMDAARGLDNQFMYYPQPLIFASLERMRGSEARAQRMYAQSLQQIQQRLREYPDDSRAHSALGIALAGLGRSEEAIREGDRGVQILPVEKESWRGSFRMLDLAQIHAMTGDQEKAIDILERLLKMPSEISPTWLKLDPRWKSLRGNKRFESLLADKS